MQQLRRCVSLYCNVATDRYNNFLVTYRTWENFGGGNFWRINGSKVFGEEKFGKSVGSLLKILTFINFAIGGENFGELLTIRKKFPTYGILRLNA